MIKIRYSLVAFISLSVFFHVNAEPQNTQGALPHEEPNPFHITNAGLIILAPFLPQLFERLKLVENGDFTSLENRSRAVYILQYLVTGKSVDVPERDLILNKVLAGMPIKQPLTPFYRLTDDEKEIANSLLQAVILNWGPLGTTSIAGLRETFIQRIGILTLDKRKVLLAVEVKAFDLVLAHLPWDISLIKFPWMEHPVYTNWR